MPFISSVEVKRSFGVAGPVPINPNGLIYRCTSSGVDPNLTTIGDGKVQFTKIVKEGCWISGSSLLIDVVSSEPLQSLTCAISNLSSYNLTSNNGINWSINIPFPAITEGTYNLTFSGTDKSGNQLINIEKFPSIGKENKSVRIPTRQSATIWDPNPTASQVGSDTYHQFIINSGCNQQLNDEELSVRSNECENCADPNNFSVKLGQIMEGNIQHVSLSNPNKIPINSYVWKDKNGIIISNNADANLPPGEYCVDIEYGQCCKATYCFTLEGCNEIVESIHVTPPSDIQCLSFEPTTIEIILKEGEIADPQSIKWYYNNQPIPLNGLIVNNAQSGQYIIKFNTKSGCYIEKTIHVDAMPVLDEIAEDIKMICFNSKGYIHLNLPQELEDDRIGWEFNWYFEDEVIGSAPNSNLDNLTNEGEYTIVFQNRFTGCTFEKSFLVQNLSYEIVNFKNPTCAGYLPDGTVTLKFNTNYYYSVRWYIGSYCDGNPWSYGDELMNAFPEEYCFSVLDMNGNLACGGSLRLDCCMKFGNDGELEYNHPKPQIIDIDLNYSSTSESCDGKITFTHNMDNGITNIIKYYKMPEHIEIGKLENLCPGEYCIYLNNGCRSSEECFKIISCDDTNFGLNASITNTCENYNAGRINVVPYGSGPFNVKWDNGSTNYIIQDLAKGQYCVTVTNLNGHCSKSYCYFVDDIHNTTRDNNCNILCNGSIVESKLPTTLGDYLPSDCRYRRQFCSDGFEIGSAFVGLDMPRIIDDDNMLLQNYCKNGQPYGPPYVCPNIDTLEDWQSCKFDFYCNGNYVKTVYGEMEYGVEEHGIDRENNCVYAFKANRCTFGDYEYYTNPIDGLSINRDCPLNPIYWNECVNSSGEEIEINSDNFLFWCWTEYFSFGILFQDECDYIENSFPKNCLEDPNWINSFRNKKEDTWIRFSQIEELQKINSTSAFVYPNPCINTLYYNNRNNISNFKFELYNSFFAKEKTQYSFDSNKDIMEINLTNLMPGIYFLKIIKENNINEIYKIIKLE